MTHAFGQLMLDDEMLRPGEGADSCEMLCASLLPNDRKMRSLPPVCRVSYKSAAQVSSFQ